MRILNLASQPYRNERTPTLLVLLMVLLALGLSVEHVLVVRRLLSGRVIGKEMAALENESRSLRAEGERLRAGRLDPGASAHWLVLKELVDRKAFSWTGLFSVLEETLPDSVRLLSIAPSVEKGIVSLAIDAVARSKEDGLDTIRVLEEREEFYDVIPTSRGGEEGTTFHYTMKYRASVSAVPAATPASEGSATGAPRPAAEGTP